MHVSPMSVHVHMLLLLDLQALFRPMAMMIPDYQLVAEVMLLSEGFDHAHTLSGKMVNLYKLASEQLSQQVSGWLLSGWRCAALQAHWPQNSLPVVLLSLYMMDTGSVQSCSSCKIAIMSLMPASI